MTQDIIAMKEKAGAQGEHDFLDRILAEKEKFTDTQIRDNVFLMFLAGHEVPSFLSLPFAHFASDDCWSSYLGPLLLGSIP